MEDQENIYVVTIGRETRKGGFLTEATRYVRSIMSSYEIHNRFVTMYQGFSVKTTPVDVMEIEPIKKDEGKESAVKFTPITVAKPEPKKDIRVDYLTDIVVKETQEEKDLRVEMSAAYELFLNKRKEFRDSVKARYKAKDYIYDIYESEIKVSINIYENSVMEKVRLAWNIIKREVEEGDV